MSIEFVSYCIAFLTNIFVTFFVSLFGLDRAQTAIDFEITVVRVIKPIKRNVPVKIFNCSVNVKTKDCAQSRPFQHELQYH